MKRRDKFKWENIKPNENCDFEMNYNVIMKLLAHLQNAVQQLAAAHKNKE
ncbi:MAG: hypothetical protein R3Y43_05480 [Alphaproteobacteria bacterium]